MRLSVATAALLGLLISPLGHAEDPTIDRLLASHCAQCHGTDGRAVGDIDELACESAKEIVEELEEMRSEDQPEDIMHHQALGYTENQIERIGRYFESMPEDEC